MHFTPLPHTKARRRLYLMRHAAVSYVKPDGSPVVDTNNVKLTDKGRGQAELMAGTLQHATFDRVVCSGLTRSLQTAQLVSGKAAEEIDVEPGFCEIQEGDLKAIPEEKLLEDLVYYMDSAGAPGARFAGGEPFVDFGARVIDSFYDLAHAPAWTSLLLVAHGIVNSVLLSYLVTGSRQAALTSMGRFEQDPCCLNVIDLDMEGDRIARSYLRTVNLTPYDPAKRDITLIDDEANYFDWLGPFDGSGES